MGRGPVSLVLIGLELVWCIDFRSDWSSGRLSAAIYKHDYTYLVTRPLSPPPLLLFGRLVFRILLDIAPYSVEWFVYSWFFAAL